MRVAVTGGAGYIGSVVTDQLLASGHAVLVVDNLSRGHRDAVPAGANFVELDLIDQVNLEAALRDFRADAVVHMAASSLVGESVGVPSKYYNNNICAGIALLDAMHGAGVSRIVFSSTAAVYGEPAKVPIDELDPMAPTNPYGETKLAFERAMRWYGGAYGLSSVSLRYFNAAGATDNRGERHDPETHLIPLVLDVAAGRQLEVAVFGHDYPTPDGTCVRDYIHVADLATAHLLALEATGQGAGLCIAYNLGGGRGYSVREIIETASRVTGRRIATRMCPRRPGDPAVLIASSDRIKSALDWRPRFDQIDAIIESAWRWMTGSGRT